MKICLEIRQKLKRKFFSLIFLECFPRDLDEILEILMNSNIIKHIYFPYWKSLQFLDFNCTEFHNDWNFYIFLIFIIYPFFNLYIYVFLKKMIQENFYLFYRMHLLILLLFVYIYFFHPQNKLIDRIFSIYSPVMVI